MVIRYSPSAGKLCLNFMPSLVPGGAGSSGFRFASIAYLTLETRGLGLPTAIALGSEGTVLRSADDGQSWQSIETGTRETLRDSVVHPASGTLVIVGSHGTVLRSSDAGQSFSKAALDSELGLRAVALSARSSLLVAVGDDGSACVSRDSAQKFVSEPTGTRHSLLKLLALPNSDRVLAAGDNGSLLVRAGLKTRNIPAPHRKKTCRPGIPE